MNVLKSSILTVSLVATAAGIAYADFRVDLDKIAHWSGEGKNRAALVIQFLDEYSKKAYVWGYRWKDGEEATGETMIRAIAAEGKDFCALIQFTGGLGSTLDGVGYSENNSILNEIRYNYQEASTDPYVMFGFSSPNTLMGQTSSPGERAAEMCGSAIENAKNTGIIEHPLNQKVFGYPAYDYDWWQADNTSENMRWNAGWYTGYWSYWLGNTSVSSDEFTYSGLGMSSVKIKNGDINAWKFMPLDGPVNPDDYVDGMTGASIVWNNNLDYEHFSGSTSVPVLIQNTHETDIKIYDISGRLVKSCRYRDIDSFPRGLYIVRIMDTNKSYKIFIK